jgi:hypothetical protein
MQILQFLIEAKLITMQKGYYSRATLRMKNTLSGTYSSILKLEVVIFEISFEVPDPQEIQKKYNRFYSSQITRKKKNDFKASMLTTERSAFGKLAITGNWFVIFL